MSAIERATVTKFGLYPRPEPTGYSVGFQVDVTGGEKFYIDTVISLEDTEELSSSEVADAAWVQIRPEAVVRADQMAENAGVVGHVVEEGSEEPDFPEWDASTNYALGDVVSHDGSLWEAIKDKPTEEPSADAKHWEPYEG